MRKVYAGILTVVLTALFLGFYFPVFEQEGPISNVLIVSPYLSVGVIYGGFVSVGIEKVTGRYGDARIAYAFILHMVAVLPIVVFPLVFFYAIQTAMTFFFIDEGLRWISMRKEKVSTI
ncbi:hypothetical protein [Thalassobacillus hwangdonensis]|uniref:Uncharacterized protein n=1 Tax=Thalassobacillus hwangdonensis TaxID=546108 RepID=A0ABW3L0L4_9BACI